MDTAENVEVVKNKSNLFISILCSILFGLVGCLVYGLLYYLGYIAWLGAYAVVILAGFGYKKFNNGMDKKGYVIISIISLIEVLLTMFVTVAISVSYTYNVSISTSFSVMFEVIGDSEVQGAFISDAIFSLVFIVAGILTYYFIEKRKKQEEQQKAQEAQSVEVSQSVDATQADEPTTEQIEQDAMSGSKSESSTTDSDEQK